MTTASTQATATGARSLREFGRGEWLAIGGLSLAFVALFFRWFATQNKHSLRSLEDWGHAYIIPVISAYVIWQHRDEIARIAPRVFWPGAAPFMLGIMSYFFCLVGVKNHMLQGFSMILTLFGLVLLLGGPRLMRHLFLPIAYLGFGVTIAEKLMLLVTFQLKLLASQGAYIMLSTLGTIFGYACDVQGNLLTITPQGGDPIPLNVAEACSGMRMVVAFVALGGAVALLSCRHWWQRIALFTLAIPVALLMNVVRVAVLGLLSIWKPDLASGQSHMLIGTLLLIPALGLFMLVVWSLERIVVDEREVRA